MRSVNYSFDASALIGLSRREAERMVEKNGFILRDMTAGGFFTDDERNDRVNVWFGTSSLAVERAEIY